MSKAPGACEPHPSAMRSGRALAVSLLVLSVAVVVVAAAAVLVEVVMRGRDLVSKEAMVGGDGKERVYFILFWFLFSRSTTTTMMMIA